MKFATLLIIALSNQGYWFGGQTGTISLRSAIKPSPAADVIWELKLHDAVLARGKTAAPHDDKEIIVRFIAPEARVRIDLLWTYRVVTREGAKEIDAGELPIRIFPDDLMNGVANRIGKNRLAVWDKPEGLPRLLNSCHIPFDDLGSSAHLDFLRADVLLVGQNMIDDSPFTQTPLLNLARAGTSVMIFRQEKPANLMGYAMALHKSPAKLQWRIDHPLFAGLGIEDLQSWSSTSMLTVLQTRPGDASRKLTSYPREDESSEAIDAVLLARSAGKERLILCQLPLGDWNRDPRSQTFLVNSIDYLLMRPPTNPSAGETAAPPKARLSPSHTIQFSGGGQ